MLMTRTVKDIVSAKLIATTQPVVGTPASNAEDLVAFCARVSSGRQYEDRGKDYEGLLKYCMKHKHWSIFEMANAVVEVQAPRDISRQLLRHRSFSFQEFSQRYSDDIEFCEREVRMQDESNRQNSIPFEEDVLQELNGWDWEVKSSAEGIYNYLRSYDTAKETARVVLPEGLTMSSLYMNGTLRSWLHYLDVREGNGTQLEHIWLANTIREALKPAFPVILGINNE